MKVLAQLNPRERLIVIIGAVVFMLSTIYFYLLDPLYIDIEQTKQAVTRSQKSLERIQILAHQYQAIDQQAKAVDDQKSILALIEETGLVFEVKAGVRKIVPEGEDRARVHFEKVSFDRLISWIYALYEDHDLDVESVDIRHSGDPGKVDGKIIFLRR